MSEHAEGLIEVRFDRFGIPLHNTEDSWPTVAERISYLLDVAPDTFELDLALPALWVTGYTPADKEYIDLQHWVRGSTSTSTRD